MLNQNLTPVKGLTVKFSNSKNINFGARRDRFLSPCIGGTTLEQREQAMEDFMATFKVFILTAGITQQMQRSFGFKYRVVVDPRWNTSAADNVSVTWRYLGAKFAIWSNGQTDGGFKVHLYGDLRSGKYRSGGLSNPEEFGRKFALLACEAERIADLPWTRKVPEQWGVSAQAILTFVMCLSFIAAPQTDWEKVQYFLAFLVLTFFSVLSYGSQIKPEDSLTDGQIEQQAIAI